MYHYPHLYQLPWMHKTFYASLVNVECYYTEGGT